MKYRFLFFFFFFLSVSVFSQVIPAENSKLHYRIIGFSFPELRGSKQYRLEIARGNLADDKFFRDSIVVTMTGSRNQVCAEVPRFGTDYTWRIVADGEKYSLLHHFTVRANRRVDSVVNRLSVFEHASAANGLYVTVDSRGVIYDLKGDPIWFLPDSVVPGNVLFDMKFTDRGTITFFCNRIGYEVDYNGNILHVMPDQDSICRKKPVLYHNEFTGLQNGHYMVMGIEDLLCRKICNGDSCYIVASKPAGRYRRNIGAVGNHNIASFGTLLEFDKNDSLVWVWKCSDYLLHSDFVYYNATDSNRKFDAHDNAFYFDENNKVIYIGFGNLDRIIKIEYPSGKLLASYGEVFTKNGTTGDAPLFYKPHSISLLPDGDLLVYASSDHTGKVFSPTALKLQERKDEHGRLKKIWECSIPASYDLPVTTEDGNVIALPDGGIYMAIGAPERAQLFLIDRKKNIIWSGKPESFDPDSGRWITPELYRSNIIGRQQLEQLISQSAGIKLK